MEKSQYDAGWEKRWYDMKRYGPYSRHVRRLLHQILRVVPFASVLDAGCGQGEFLLEILAHYPEVHSIAGLDVSKSSIAIVEERLQQGHFQVLDIQTGYLDANYDLVTCMDVLEHLPDDVSALRNLHRMTGKYLLASTVQGHSLPQWEAEVVGHVRNYRRGELVNKMQHAGFSIERVIEWGYPFYSPLYRWGLTVLRGQGTDGEYGWHQRLIAQLIYQLFRLNSTRRGDLVIVLARS